MKQFEGVQLFGFTEHQCETLTFHCHPNYRNEGPWFDYVMIAWEQEEHYENKSDEDSLGEMLTKPVATMNDMEFRNSKLTPAKFICFIKNQNSEMNVFVHTCLDSKNKLSVLTYQWELARISERQQKTNPNKVSDEFR